MRDESAFNQYLGKELTKLHQQKLSHMKAADKFRSGVSDFLVWWMGTSLALECKFVKNTGQLPYDSKKKLLSHPFTGEQITFLEGISLSGNLAWGLVALDFSKQMILIPCREIPEVGNWRICDFLEEADGVFKAFYYNDVKAMLESIMGRV